MRFLVVVSVITFASVASAQTCTGGQMLCGTMHCSPVGQVCCAPQGHEELSCSPPTTCTTDGMCKCPNGGTMTIAGCGGDMAGCSAPCMNHSDCDSGCCTTAGFCAPLCVCQGQGKLFLGTTTTGMGYSGKPSGGCSAAPGQGAGAPGVLLIGLALIATLWVRRTSHTHDSRRRSRA